MFTATDHQLLLVFDRIERSATECYTVLLERLRGRHDGLDERLVAVLDEHRQNMTALEGLLAWLERRGLDDGREAGDSELEGEFREAPSTAEDDSPAACLRKLIQVETRYLAFLESMHRHLGHEAMAVVDSRILVNARRSLLLLGDALQAQAAA